MTNPIFLEIIAHSAILHFAINSNNNLLANTIKAELDILNKNVEDDNSISYAEYELIMKDCIEISKIMKQLFDKNGELLNVKFVDNAHPPNSE